MWCVLCECWQILCNSLIAKPQSKRENKKFIFEKPADCQQNLKLFYFYVSRSFHLQFMQNRFGGAVYLFCSDFFSPFSLCCYGIIYSFHFCSFCFLNFLIGCCMQPCVCAGFTDLLTFKKKIFFLLFELCSFFFVFMCYFVVVFFSLDCVVFDKESGCT